MTTGSNYVIYAGLLTSAAAYFGWVISPDAALVIVGGIVALAGTIYNHYATRKAVAAGLRPIR